MKVFLKKAWKRGIRNWQLYLMFLPVFLYFLIFHYFPMYGIQIAFKDFSGALGIWESPWVGMAHFERFFQQQQFWGDDLQYHYNQPLHARSELSGPDFACADAQ